LFQYQLALSGTEPRDVRAHVSSALPELETLFDNFGGFANGWRVLRDLYAPKVLLGMALNEWGAEGLDLSKEVHRAPSIASAARQTANFTITLAPNVWDFAALEIAYSEEGKNPSRQEVFSPAEKDGVVTFVRDFVRASRIPVVIDGVPLGNNVSKAISDRDYHWRDTWVPWLMGSDGFTGLHRLRDAGVIGVSLGVAKGADETCPCDAARDGVTNGAKRGIPSTSADDDGGYLAARLAALRDAGGLALRPADSS